MKETRTITIEVEICDKCGDELFRYKENGEAPRHTPGIYIADTDETYCEMTCVPE